MASGRLNLGPRVTEAEANKMGFENACRFLRFDPFTDIPKEEATVGALRARAADDDASTRSKAEYKAAFESALASA
jgi:hypothetical protein